VNLFSCCQSRGNHGGNEVSDYDRGFEDGWMDVCEDIRQISPEFYRVLYDRKTC
jgi:hypothetical protein